MKQKLLYFVIINSSYTTIQITYREKSLSVEYVLVSELMFNG